MLDLAGSWTLSDESGAFNIKFVLPGDGISALTSAGSIPDPYWGRNEYDLRWICGRDWVAPLCDYPPPIHFRWPEYITTPRGQDWWIPSAMPGA